MIVALGHKIKSGKDTVANMIRFLVEYERIVKEENFETEQTLYQEYLDFCRVDDLDYAFEVKRFADKIKEIVCLLIGCTLEQLEDHNFKNKELGEEWWVYDCTETTGRLVSYINSDHIWMNEMEYPLIKLTPRLLFNLIGTESGRKIIHPNIWVNALFSAYISKVPPIGSKTKEWLQNNTLSNWIITDTRFPNEAEAVKSKGGIVVKIQRDFCFDSLEDYLVCYPDKQISKRAAQLVQEFKGEYRELLEHFARMFPEETKQFLSNSHLLESETALDNYTGWDDVIMNNGTKEELLLEVQAFMKRHKII